MNGGAGNVGNLTVILWAIFAVITGVGQTVTLAITLEYCMQIFAYWVFLYTGIVFVIAFFVVLLYYTVFTKEITPEMRKISHTKWVVIGVLTMLNGTFLLFSGPHVDGVLQAILGPTVIVLPMCMVLCFFFLKIRYSYGQLAGVTVILAGIAIALYPAATGTPTNGHQQSLFWALMWVMGSVPMAVLYVYEEKTMKEDPIHMAHLMAWSTLYQQIAVIVFATPLSMIPGVGGAGPSDFFSHQADGWRCFMGIVPASCPTCECSSAATFVCLFTFFYIATNYANLGVLKHGSATLAFVVTTLITPLAALTFSAGFLLGKLAEPVQLINVYALLTLLAGVCIYRASETRANRVIDELEEESVHGFSVLSSSKSASRANTPASLRSTTPIAIRGMSPYFAVSSHRTGEASRHRRNKSSGAINIISSSYGATSGKVQESDDTEKEGLLRPSSLPTALYQAEMETVDTDFLEGLKASTEAEAAKRGGLHSDRDLV